MYTYVCVCVHICIWIFDIYEKRKAMNRTQFYTTEAPLILGNNIAMLSQPQAPVS